MSGWEVAGVEDQRMSVSVFVGVFVGVCVDVSEGRRGYIALEVVPMTSALSLLSFPG